MHIVEIILYRVRVPFKRAFRHSRTARAETENIIVEVVTDLGLSGFGEGVPREYVTGETPAAAMNYLAGLDFSFIEGPWRSLEDGLRRLGEWETAARREGNIFPGAARCALSLALLDAITRAHGAGVSGIAPYLEWVLRENDRPKQIRYSAVCSGGSVASMVSTLLQYRLYGFHAVKLKVGWGEERDILILRLARKLLGHSADIRVDANGAWDTQSAIRVIKRMEPFGISSVEEPLRPELRDELPLVRRSARVPVMLDESVCDQAQLTEVIERGLCDMVNIRLSKCGGFFASLQMARRLCEKGFGYQLGCQVGETGLLSAAGRHFAFLVPGIRHVEGSYDRHLLRENITREDPTFGYGGRAGPLGGPGLGVTVARETLRRCTIEQRELYES